MAQSASKTFTASNLPPKPTSRIATSTWASEKIIIAAIVPYSKYVSVTPSLADSILENASQITSSETARA